MALSAFDSFCRGAERGRFPLLTDRDDLWHLLLVITAGKAFDQLEHQGRRKRGGGTAEAPGPFDPLDEADLDALASREPTPELAAQMAEECQRLLAGLGDPELRQVALWKMEGSTNEEIAARLGCVLRTVERKLRVIRDLWNREVQT